MPKASSAPRLIYPDAALSESLAACSIGAQLLFDRLIATADDQGRHRAGAAAVWSVAFPRLRKVRETDVARWLDELETAGMIVRYTADGKDLLQLRAWWEWQRLEWARESRWPPPEGWSDRVGKRPGGPFRTSPDSSGVVRQNQNENQNENQNRKRAVRTSSGPERIGSSTFREALSANGFAPPETPARKRG